MHKKLKNKWTYRLMFGLVLFFIALFLTISIYTITVGELPTNNFILAYPSIILLWIIPIALIGKELMAYVYSGLAVTVFLLLSLYNDSYQHIYREPKSSTYMLVFLGCMIISAMIEYYYRHQVKS